MFWCWWFCVGACGGVVVLVILNCRTVFAWWCFCGGV